MKVYVLTDIGKVRLLNEDAYYIPKMDEEFCAVADGMGGHNAGEVASAMAVEIFSGEMCACVDMDAAAIRRAVEYANAQVYSRSCSSDNFSGMGTTFTALCRAKDSALIAHVGDSRCYLIRDGEIMRVTMDHTLVEEMVLKGIITMREAKYHPKRNYITRALGTAPSIDVDVIRIDIRKGDVFFLCTDGLTGYVEDDEILSVTMEDASWTAKLQELVGRALYNGGGDNVTAMYAVFDEEDLK